MVPKTYTREELEHRYDELEKKYNDLGWQMKSLQRENDQLKAIINKESN